MHEPIREPVKFEQRVHVLSNGAYLVTHYVPGYNEYDTTSVVEGNTYRFVVGDGLAFLRTYPWSGTELVYCDPPYLRQTRRTKTRLYRHEMDEQHHKDLIAILTRLPCAVLLSGYTSELYSDLLSDWRMLTFQTMTRGGKATEVLWMNYPPPTSLHDYQYAGEDFRARERQKRQQERWLTKVVAKPLIEQKRLLSGLLTKLDEDTRADVLRSVTTQPDDAAAQAQMTTVEGKTRCTICRSSARARIDQALVSGLSIRDIADKEGVSKSVIGRHRAHVTDGKVSQLQPTSGTTFLPPQPHCPATSTQQPELLPPETPL